MALAIVTGVLEKVVANVVSGVATAAITQQTRSLFENLTNEVKIEKIKTVIKNAKEILNKESGLDLSDLKSLAYTQTEAEFYQNLVNYIFKHKSMVDINTWTTIDKALDTIISNLQRLIDKASGQTSSSRTRTNESEKPPHNLRRFLLLLSAFPSDVVFNHKRVARLSVANEFILESGSESLLQQLSNWVEEVDRIWDDVNRVALAHHFRIRSNEIREQVKDWPESDSPWPQNALIDERNKTLQGENFLSSLIIHGPSDEAKKLEKAIFLCLRILSLRNINLSDWTYLKKLIFLQYLDLKRTNIDRCDWLESLEELQVLDLRYTKVENIPGDCLKKLGKLQHLLLGYIPDKGVNGLTGVKLNIETLMTENLETLRAIRRPNKTDRSISKVVDLSVTGLKTEHLKNFWNAVKNFEKLTILGVALIEGSVVTLQDCPKELQHKLKRLRMEGRFTSSSTSSQPASCLDKLKDFTRLIDLTLVSPKAVNGIPPLPKLICLRLYGIHKDEVLTFNEPGFEALKKLVIGDIKNVKTVKIGATIISALATLKLCDLPRFTQLFGSHDSQHPLLSLNNRKGTKVTAIQSQINIFLKGIPTRSSGYDLCWSPGLKIYHYMNNQCYKLIEANPAAN